MRRQEDSVRFRASWSTREPGRDRAPTIESTVPRRFGRDAPPAPFPTRRRRGSQLYPSAFTKPRQQGAGSEAPDLLDAYKSRLSIAMPDLGPARRRGDVSGIDELEQDVLLGLEHQRCGCVWIGEDIGYGRAHQQHAPLADRFLLDPGDRAARVANLEPALDVDDDLERIITAQRVQWLGLDRGR